MLHDETLSVNKGIKKETTSFGNPHCVFVEHLSISRFTTELSPLVNSNPLSFVLLVNTVISPTGLFRNLKVIFQSFFFSIVSLSAS